LSLREEEEEEEEVVVVEEEELYLRLETRAENLKGAFIE